MIESNLINALYPDYVKCNLCHEPVPEISKATEPAHRYHPTCRPEAIAAKQKRLDELKLCKTSPMVPMPFKLLTFVGKVRRHK